MTTRHAVANLASPAPRLRRICVLAVVVMAAAVACSDADDDTGSGIAIRDRLYYATCAPVDEALLADELGRHKFQLETVRVRAVNGIVPTKAVAVLQPAGCALDDITWTLWPSDVDVAGMLPRLDDYRHLMDEEKLERLVEYEECVRASDAGADDCR